MKTEKALILALFITLSNLVSSQSPIFLNAKKNFEDKKFEESKKMFNLIGKNNAEYAEARYFLGMILLTEKDYDAAIESLNEAIKKDGKKAEYYYMLGNAYGEKTMVSNVVKQAMLAKEILKSWETAAKLDSMHQGVRWGLMNYYTMAPSFMGGGMDKAYKMADELNRVKYPDGFEAKGYVYERDKKSDLAEKSFKEAIKAKPNELKYTYALAYFYMRNNGNDKALGVWNKLIENYPEDSRAYLELGNINSSNSKMLEQAKDNLMHFLQIVDKNDNSNKSRANFYLGNISNAKGDKVNAKKYFETSLLLFPDNKEVKDALEELEKK